MPMTVQFDEVDEAILTARLQLLNTVSGPRVGDFVRYADGHLERISALWDEWEDIPAVAQTSEEGSFYLGHGCLSFSGGLNPGVPVSELRLTAEMLEGSCWFFHHDQHRGHNGVQASGMFRVYEVAEHGRSR